MILAIVMIIYSGSCLLHNFQPVVGASDNRSLTITGLENNTNVIIKPPDPVDHIPYIISFVTTAVGVSTVLIGLKTYRTQSKESRILRKKDIQKDIIFPIILEFDTSPGMQLAKDIIDDKRVKRRKDWENPADYYSIRNLSIILRDHKSNGIYDPGEVAIRHSFDIFLDFLCKLEYLKEIELMDSKEMGYFKYYIKKASKKKPIMEYIQIYEFPLHIESLLN